MFLLYSDLRDSDLRDLTFLTQDSFITPMVQVHECLLPVFPPALASDFVDGVIPDDVTPERLAPLKDWVTGILAGGSLTTAEQRVHAHDLVAQVTFRQQMSRQLPEDVTSAMALTNLANAVQGMQAQLGTVISDISTIKEDLSTVKEDLSAVKASVANIERRVEATEATAFNMEVNAFKSYNRRQVDAGKAPKWIPTPSDGPFPEVPLSTKEALTNQPLANEVAGVA